MNKDNKVEFLSLAKHEKEQPNITEAWDKFARGVVVIYDHAIMNQPPCEIPKEYKAAELANALYEKFGTFQFGCIDGGWPEPNSLEKWFALMFMDVVLEHIGEGEKFKEILKIVCKDEN